MLRAIALFEQETMQKRGLETWHALISIGIRYLLNCKLLTFVATMRLRKGTRVRVFSCSGTIRNLLSQDRADFTVQ